MTKTNLPEKYDHKIREQKWQDFWKEQEIYKWDSSKKREDNYVIDTPPPTVSGLLHMGHIFSYTQADFVARYQRMKGKNVFYPMGFDDNGLPTERLVEKIKNVKGGMMERADFIKLCKEVVVESEEEFRKLFNSIALSVDWTQEYQTISDHTRKISQLSFLDLFKKDKLYRKMQPTLWDPADRTALAQADIEDKELESSMNDIAFLLENSDEKIIIATTRPELLPACVCIFAHPDDSRYSHLIGKNAYTPLFGVKVPIIADDLVQMEKGTGLVMCCTFGDQTDIEWWKKHNLPTRVMIDSGARLTGLAKITDGEFGEIKNKIEASEIIAILEGLTVKQARAKILEILGEKELLIKQTKITHAVKCAERSGCPLEIIVTPQWFIKITDSKKELLEKSAECNWYPKHMQIRMDQWINNISWDWCISRQRFFGVPFPVWYSKRQGEEGKIIVADSSKLPIDPLVDLPDGYSRDEVEAEIDVMDTWATSSVTPQISSYGINDEYGIDKERHQKLYPADLRPQAHEIIRSWAFYTLAKAHLHNDQIPWKNLMISGWCLASDKTKMSKSKGNVVTPTALIEEKGSDVVRYWASTSNLGADTAYSEDVLSIGKKLVNKLWNAGKFASLHIDNIKGTPTTAKQDVENGKIYMANDLWILSKLKQVITEYKKQFEIYEYAKAREAIDEFFWKDFCDNYLEIVKTRSYGDVNVISGFLGLDKKHPVCSADTPLKEGNEEGNSPWVVNNIQTEQQSSLYTIYHVLDTILNLFSPFVPHVTEELYQGIFAGRYNKSEGSIHKIGNLVSENDLVSDDKSILLGDLLVSILDQIRKYKSANNLSMKAEINEMVLTSNFDEGTVDPSDIIHLPDFMSNNNGDGNDNFVKNFALIENDLKFVGGVLIIKIQDIKNNIITIIQ